MLLFLVLELMQTSQQKIPEGDSGCRQAAYQTVVYLLPCCLIKYLLLLQIQNKIKIT